MLGRRRRRRANIHPALGQCMVFAGYHHSSVHYTHRKAELFFQSDLFEERRIFITTVKLRYIPALLPMDQTNISNQYL